MSFFFNHIEENKPHISGFLLNIVLKVIFLFEYIAIIILNLFLSPITEYINFKFTKKESFPNET